MLPDRERRRAGTVEQHCQRVVRPPSARAASLRLRSCTAREQIVNPPKPKPKPKFVKPAEDMEAKKVLNGTWNLPVLRPFYSFFDEFGTHWMECTPT